MHRASDARAQRDQGGTQAMLEDCQNPVVNLLKRFNDHGSTDENPVVNLNRV